ncbi:MAG: ferrochelatase [Candidatus Microbacterium colombiense]|nr:MAG: ferrochelatase [Microbacterium sp.]
MGHGSGPHRPPRSADVSWELVYQSRSGPASQPWLEPDVCDVIGELPARGRKAVAVVPLGFMSDHMEVLWDLDTEAMEAAEEAGLRAVRTPTPGVAPAFVAGIVDLIEERLPGTPERRPPARDRPRPVRSTSAARMLRERARRVQARRGRHRP